MTLDFWQRCLDNDVVVLPVEAYTWDSWDEREEVGMKFYAFSCRPEIMLGEDYACVSLSGKVALFDTPEEALEDFLAKAVKA